jgi:hypothetical protein
MADFLAAVMATGLRSFRITLSIDEISLATLIDLAPTPLNASAKVIGTFLNRHPLSLIKELYTRVDMSLLSLAAGLKNAGVLGGTFV